jgi:Fe(3+) dicitrate transport protein
MKLKDFKLLIFIISAPFLSFTQVDVFGEVYDKVSVKGLESVEIYDEFGALLATTNSEGKYQFSSYESKLKLIFFRYGYQPFKTSVVVNGSISKTIFLELSAEQLSEVELIGVKQKLFSIKRLKDVEGTAIFAGKKTEVILVDNLMANLASNNAR